MEHRTIHCWDEGWAFFQLCITKLKNILEGRPETQFTPDEYMKIYMCVSYSAQMPIESMASDLGFGHLCRWSYNMCTQKSNHSQQLYDKYREIFVEYLTTEVSYCQLIASSHFKCLCICQCRGDGQIIPGFDYLHRAQEIMIISMASPIWDILFLSLSAFQHGSSVQQNRGSYLGYFLPLYSLILAWLQCDCEKLSNLASWRRKKSLEAELHSSGEGE